MKLSASAQRGFTLIEMLVSIALFAVVVTTSMGTLLVLIDANAKSQSIQISINNLSFALDAMTRQIRTGYDYRCGATQASITTGTAPGTVQSGTVDCADGGQAIAFTDTRTGARVAYAYNPTSQTIQRKIDLGASRGNWEDMTGSNLRISEMEFVVRGAPAYAPPGVTDRNQPTVTIYITAEVGDTAGLGAQFDIQTSLTQRALQI